jgi:hypothetical protein
MSAERRISFTYTCARSFDGISVYFQLERGEFYTDADTPLCFSKLNLLHLSHFQYFLGSGGICILYGRKYNAIRRALMLIKHFQVMLMFIRQHNFR